MPSSDYKHGESLTALDVSLGIIYSPLRQANVWSSDR